MATSTLEIYTRPLCLDCQKLKDFLTHNGIPFQAYNVENNPEREKELKMLTGSRIVPALIFRKTGLWKKQKVIIGYEANQKQIAQLIENLKN